MEEENTKRNYKSRDGDYQVKKSHIRIHLDFTSDTITR